MPKKQTIREQLIHDFCRQTAHDCHAVVKLHLHEQTISKRAVCVASST